MRPTKIKGCLIAALVAVVLTAGAFAALPLAGSALWLPRTTIDRVNPLAHPTVTYAPAPEPGSWVETYEDATGSGNNYVYELRGREENGREHVSYLVCFGEELEVRDAYMRITAKGCYAERYAFVPAGEVPRAAR